MTAECFQKNYKKNNWNHSNKSSYQVCKSKLTKIPNVLQRELDSKASTYLPYYCVRHNLPPPKPKWCLNLYDGTVHNNVHSCLIKIRASWKFTTIPRDHTQDYYTIPAHLRKPSIVMIPVFFSFSWLICGNQSKPYPQFLIISCGM